MTNTHFRRALVTTALIVLGGISIPNPTLAQTPNLSLSYSPSSTTVGSTVTIYLTLNDTASNGNNLFAFDTNIYIDNRYTSFVGAPYTETYTGFGTSTLGFTNTVHSSSNGNAYATQSTTQTAIEVEQDIGFGGGATVTNHGSLQLGYFTVQITNPLPAGGTVVSLGTTTTGLDTATTGGSDLDDETTFTNVLASTTNTTIVPAPEPSGAVVFLIGLLGLGLAAKWRSRSRTEETEPA